MRIPFGVISPYVRSKVTAERHHAMSILCKLTQMDIHALPAAISAQKDRSLAIECEEQWLRMLNGLSCPAKSDKVRYFPCRIAFLISDHMLRSPSHPCHRMQQMPVFAINTGDDALLVRAGRSSARWRVLI